MDLYDEYCVKPDSKVKLKDIHPREDKPFKDREEAEQLTTENVEAIRQLQYRMFVEGKQSLLIVLQAPDAAGKDGLIRRVLGKMNPQGCRVHSFKKPTELELAHDFLWRVHPCVPARGQVSIFNRSHYEDVLIVRVHDLVPKSVWKERYDLINSFESLLSSAGTRILKFYLHISPEEQLERFKERLDLPEKHWKLNAADYHERDRWDDYREAYQTVFEQCSPKHAPWFVIPADRKWYRNAVVSQIVRKTLEEMNPQLPPVTEDLAEIRRLYGMAEGEE
ncbi:Thymidylate kinase [Rosistilla carotiformis]|uniref:Thymidylate kinase n=1 Tax=Rosistilla carotiformis TaxID=2528017 RepID=A0A518JUH8_9BACT|nr:polyphosphate kinase 2 family protein [Rosistilla carotiformis]QDV69200.1 Thymidylate kinase [Rosistilla carotiformis]